MSGLKQQFLEQGGEIDEGVPGSKCVRLKFPEREAAAYEEEEVFDSDYGPEKSPRVAIVKSFIRYSDCLVKVLQKVEEAYNGENMSLEDMVDLKRAIYEIIAYLGQGNSFEDIGITFESFCNMVEAYGTVYLQNKNQPEGDRMFLTDIEPFVYELKDAMKVSQIIIKSENDTLTVPEYRLLRSRKNRFVRKEIDIAGIKRRSTGTIRELITPDVDSLTEKRLTVLYEAVLVDLLKEFAEEFVDLNFGNIITFVYYLTELKPEFKAIIEPVDGGVRMDHRPKDHETKNIDVFLRKVGIPITTMQIIQIVRQKLSIDRAIVNLINGFLYDGDESLGLRISNIIRENWGSEAEENFNQILMFLNDVSEQLEQLIEMYRKGDLSVVGTIYKTLFVDFKKCSKLPFAKQPPFALFGLTREEARKIESIAGTGLK